MTTRAEIKKWVQPLIERYPTMVQARHFLVLRPIGHLMRTIAFFGGSQKQDLNPHWLVCPLFVPRGLLNTFGRDIPVGQTDWPGFSEKFYERTNQAIERYLLPHETIQSFHDLAWGPQAFFHGTFKNFPLQNSVLLAAMGRFDEAEAGLVAPLAELEIRAEAYLKDGRALLAKRANSRQGKFCVEHGTSERHQADHLLKLLGLLGRKDAPAIATLLREWERLNVRRWGVEVYWQPTPFPFETA